MGLSLISYPQLVYKQAAAPAAVAGGIWYDTDDHELYFSNGSSWTLISSGADSAGYEAKISEIIIEILRLSAEGTLTAPDYNSMYCDIVADADGQDDTIDTGNTTALFQTDKYANGDSEENAHGSASTDGQNITAAWGKCGMRIDVGASGATITTATKDALSDVTNVYVGTTIGGVEAGSGTFTGNVCTFASPLTLTASTTYYIMTDKGGSSNYTERYRGAGTLVNPASAAYDWYGRVDYDDNESLNTMSNITALHIEDVPADLIVQLDKVDLNFTPAYIQLYAKNTIAGTGSVTFDVSFDNGSTWDSTDNLLNTKTAVTDGSAKQMIIKINVNGVGSGNTAEVNNYAAILWSS